VNRETKRMLQRQGQLGPDGAPTAAPRPAPAPRPAAAGARGGPERQSLVERSGEYVREVRNELVKVAWPGRAEVVNYTIVVFVTLVLVTAIVFGLDFAFAKAVILLFGTKH
jgi:preprotein translocase subunit SecE